MNIQKIRYYLSVCCLVLGCSIPIMGIVVWGITEVFPLEGRALYIAYASIYSVLVLVGLRVYIPKLNRVA